MVTPTTKPFKFRTTHKVDKTGYVFLLSLVMYIPDQFLIQVGVDQYGDNNGSTILANNPITLVPFSVLLLCLLAPNRALARKSMFLSWMSSLLCTNDLVLSGWDISGVSMDNAMECTHVLDYDLQRQVTPYLTLGSPTSLHLLSTHILFSLPITEHTDAQSKD